jgi:hypothetical protein
MKKFFQAIIYCIEKALSSCSDLRLPGISSRLRAKIEERAKPSRGVENYPEGDCSNSRGPI